MADELNKKPNPNQVSTPNPAPKQEPKAAPKMNSAPAPAPAPKKNLQANNPLNTGSKKPGFDGNNNSTRQKIMKQGFAPKNWDGKSDVESVKPSIDYSEIEKRKNETPEQSYARMKEQWKKEREQASASAGDNDYAIIEERNGQKVAIGKGKLPANYEQVEDFTDMDDNRLVRLRKDINGNDMPNPKNGKYYTNDDIPDIEEDMPESEERSKASELYGTDLNKKPGRDYDRLSQDLDKGDFVNLDAGLLPYEHGFETNGHEDLAVDARKNPETGKYEVHMYPETENGPVSGYEPDQNEPTYEFDTFDDLKAFIENGYKQQQTPQWNKDNDPGSFVVTKDLQDWTRDYLTKQVGKEYADTVVNNLSRDNKVADFYKGLMKKEFDQKYGGGNQ